MKAFVLHDVMDYRIDEVPVPDIPAGGMLVKVRACGLCGSDLRTIGSGHRHVRFPWIRGHEICGEVAAYGQGYAGPWKIGERISIGPNTYVPDDPFCIEGRHELSAEIKEIAQAWPGGLAEYIAIPEESVVLGNILRPPEHLIDVYAAVVEPGSSVIHAHERARTTIGDTVLVMGAGPVGCIHMMVARAFGADRIIVSDVQPKRLELAAPFGPDAVIDASKGDIGSRVADLTDGRGPDVIITANASPQAQVDAVRMAAKGGRVVLFGGLPHDHSSPGVDMNLVHYKNLLLIGISKFSPRHFRKSLQMLASGRIPGEKLVTDVLPLTEAGKGVKAAMSGEALKVVFIP